MTLRTDSLLVALCHAPFVRLMAVAACCAIIIDMRIMLAYKGLLAVAVHTVCPIRPAFLMRLMALIAHELHGRVILDINLYLGITKAFRRSAELHVCPALVKEGLSLFVVTVAVKALVAVG